MAMVMAGVIASRARLLAVAAALAAAAPAQTDGPGEAARLVRDVQASDYATWRPAMERLAALGGAARRALVAGLPETGEECRRGQLRVVQLIGRLGAEGTAAVMPLIGLVPRADGRMTDAIIDALGHLAPHAPTLAARIRAAMEGVLDRANRAVGHDAAGVAFGLVSPRHQGAFRTHARTLLSTDASADALVAGLRHDSPYVRELAIELLAARRHATSSIVDGLATATRSEHPKKVSVGDLEVAIDYDRRLQHAAARTLAKLAAHDPRSVPAHVRVLQLPFPEERRASVLALGRIGPAATAAVPALIDLLEQDLASVRREAITALGMIGPGARAAIPILERFAADRRQADKQVGVRARAALRQIRGE